MWKKELKLIVRRSVISGVPQTVLTKDIYRRILRFLVICVCLFGFIYHTTFFLKAYWSYPTVMDVEISSPEDVEVPAISVCSYNGILAEEFCVRFPDLCSPKKNITQFCKVHPYFCDLNKGNTGNETVPAILPIDLPPMDRSYYSQLGPLAKDLVVSCIFRSSTDNIPCPNETQRVNVFDTMGLPNNCYAFNSLVGNVSGLPQIIKSKTSIMMSIRAETTNSFYGSTPYAIQIAVHNPKITTNPFRTGISIKPCFNYNVYLSKIVYNLLPAPYSTNCTDFEELWKSRGGYGPLSKYHCREECILNASIAEAECADTFYISYPNMAKMCRKDVDNERFAAMCSDKCARSCYYEDFTTVIEEHAPRVAKNRRKRVDECLAIVTFSFDRMKVKTFNYYPKYQDVEMFSYIGGYLGVWLGVSLLAISDLLEALYFIVRISKYYFFKWITKNQEHPRDHTPKPFIYPKCYDEGVRNRHLVKIV